eukprot:1071919-Prymnesium_polylepis.1
MEKGANAKKSQGWEVGETLKSSPWAAALRAVAKVEVTKVDPKWLKVLPMCYLNMTRFHCMDK